MHGHAAQAVGVLDGCAGQGVDSAVALHNSDRGRVAAVGLQITSGQSGEYVDEPVIFKSGQLLNGPDALRQVAFYQLVDQCFELGCFV